MQSPFSPEAEAQLEPLPPPATDLWDRIVRGYAIPDLNGPLVAKWEKWYSDRPDYVERMVARSQRYLYHIVVEVQQRGMPTEIALLPMVESAFNPTALSSARAAGIWQFIPSTGNVFGLRQNFWFDSRRDVLAATTSALDYLEKLHAQFGDWQLALAAYNWGEGNVARAIARNKAKGLPTDYASLTKVPIETRNYVPKLQAIKNIVRDPEHFNLTLADIPDAPYFTVVQTQRPMDVKRAAELAEMPVDDFLALNPRHNRPVIAGADAHTLLLPIDKAERFVAKLELSDQPLVSWQAHRLRPGETLAQVATKYKMSIETLRAVNGIGARSRVPVGHALLVPAERASTAAIESLANVAFTTVPPARTTIVKARRGDTLASIAARQGVTVAELREWNALAGDRLQAGQPIRVVMAAPTAKPRSRGSKAPAAAKVPAKDSAPAGKGGSGAPQAGVVIRPGS